MDPAKVEKVISRFTSIEDTLQQYMAHLFAMSVEFQQVVGQQEEAFRAMTSQIQLLVTQFSIALNHTVDKATPPTPALVQFPTLPNPLGSH